MSWTPYGNLSLHPVYFIYSYTNAMHFIFRLRMLLKLLVYSSNQIILTARWMCPLLGSNTLVIITNLQPFPEESTKEQEGQDNVRNLRLSVSSSRITYLYTVPLSAGHRDGVLGTGGRQWESSRECFYQYPCMLTYYTPLYTCTCNLGQKKRGNSFPRREQRPTMEETETS